VARDAGAPVAAVEAAAGLGVIFTRGAGEALDRKRKNIPIRTIY